MDIPEIQFRYANLCKVKLLFITAECLNFCKKFLLRWRIVVNLAPCSCAGAVEYIVHSCSVLVAKPDLVARCIHRLDQSRILPACKSLLRCRTCSAGCGLSRCSVVAAQLRKSLLNRHIRLRTHPYLSVLTPITPGRVVLYKTSPVSQTFLPSLP